MTIREMHSWFDILQMKGNGAEFTRREKDHILTRAQVKYVNELLHKVYLPSVKLSEKPEMVYSPTESVVSGHEALKPLLGYAVTTSGTIGQTTYSDIETEIQDRLIALGLKPTGWTGAKLLEILGVAINSTSSRPSIACRYYNGYDRYRNNKNIYRGPKPHQPVYQLEETFLNIDPNDWAGEDIVVHYIREPEPMFYDASVSPSVLIHHSHPLLGTPTAGWSATVTGADVNCELPDFTHDEILAIALDDAGVATRDQTLMQLNTANKDNLTSATS